jgi:hypothetical protein
VAVDVAVGRGVLVGVLVGTVVGVGGTAVEVPVGKKVGTPVGANRAVSVRSGVGVLSLPEKGRLQANRLPANATVTRIMPVLLFIFPLLAPISLSL